MGTQEASAQRHRPPVARAAARMVGFSWEHLRGDFLRQSILALVRALLPAIQVVLVGQLTTAITAGDTGRTPGLVLATAVSVGLAAALADAENAGWQLMRVTIRTRMSSVLVERLANLTPGQVADPDWSGRGQEARESIQQHASYYLFAIIGSLEGIISAIGLVIALWGTSPGAALLILASLIPVLASYLLIARLEESSFTDQARPERTARYLQDQLTYQRTASELISLGSSRRVAGWFTDRMEQVHHIAQAQYRRQTGIMMAGALITTLALGGALYLVSMGTHPSAGGAAGGVVAVLSAASVVRGMGYSLGSIMVDSGPVAHFFDFLDATTATPLQVVDPAPVQHLTVDGVGYTYPQASRPALSDVHLEVRRGEMIALVGSNGAGKTTLVNLLNGALTSSEGAITVDGRNLATLSEPERLATFSLLTQEFGRYELTVRDTVLLGTPREDVTDEDVWLALEVGQAAGFVRDLPDGLDTMLGQQWGGVGLSGGQWQRLALARIALRGAPIWLLDEPTSAVDAETEEEIFNELGEHRGERITIIVSHRAWTLRKMDRIYVLDHGQIVQTGTYANLIAAPGRFHDMFRQQSDAIEPPA